jgi:hypothetical protein
VGLAEPVAEPVAGPVAEPVAGPVAEPVAGPVAEPVSGPVHLLAFAHVPSWTQLLPRPPQPAQPRFSTSPIRD